ncbi:MAG TPA: RsmB/NOP family class I SAM-dependent RNA methyltransferase, partial [Candidatus Aquilonibacter sp.]
TWLVRQWHGVFGSEIEAICAAVNEPAQSAVTVNTMQTNVPEVVERFASAGITATRSAFVPESLLVDDAAKLRGLEPQAKGAWWLQSESSAMPVEVLQPQPEEAILDVCSGRGNKALQIGARLAGDGNELCIERDGRKAKVLQARLEEAGIAAGVVVGDATAALLAPSQRFDRALIDAPCSGVGVIGRHAEARWKKQPGDGERLALTQRALLEALAQSVHEGGALVYAVCSTDPRETVEVVDWFLGKANVERGLIPAAFEPFITEAGDVLVPPGLDGRDGFYIARLERR